MAKVHSATVSSEYTSVTLPHTEHSPRLELKCCGESCPDGAALVVALALSLVSLTENGSIGGGELLVAWRDRNFAAAMAEGWGWSE